MEGQKPETLIEGRKALDKLKASKFEDKDEDRKNFEPLQLAFKVMKSPGNDFLCEYVSLMKEVLEFMQTPKYHNFFSERKLSHNLVKRCLIRPFCEKIMLSDENGPQVLKLKEKPASIQQINEALSYLTKQDLRTEYLLQALKPHLDTYINLLQSDPQASSHFKNDIHILSTLSQQCHSSINFDFYEKEQFFALFRSKTPAKMGQYIRVLDTLTKKVQMDKKVKKQLFAGDMEKFAQFMRENLEYMLQKNAYDFAMDELENLCNLAKKTESLVVKPGQAKLKQKLRVLFEELLEVQGKKFPKLQLEERFGQVYKEEAKPVPAKQFESPRPFIEKPVGRKFLGPNLPPINKFLTEMLSLFEKVPPPHYNTLDDEIVEKLKDDYTSQMGSSQLSAAVFKFFDKHLGNYLSIYQAKNAKKLLKAVSKARILQKVEIDALFLKANRFLDKQTFAKEKKLITKEIKEDFISGKYRQKQQDKEPQKEQHREEEEEEEEEWEEEEQYDEEEEDDAVYGAEEGDYDTEDEYHTEEDESEEEAPRAKPNKRAIRAQEQREGKHGTYLKKFREDQKQKQQDRYDELMTAHYGLRKDFVGERGTKKLAGLNALIQKIYAEEQANVEQLQQRDKVILNIKRAFQEAIDSEYHTLLTGDIKISGFGSCQNGLWNPNSSDIDVTAIFVDQLNLNQLQLLEACSKIIRKVAQKGSLILVPAKKVPLLKFVEQKTNLDVDFNVNNVLGIYNSELLYTYCQVDQRFHIMATFLKYWSKKVGIIGAANGYLSSYALALMLIAFLQSVPQPPVLPNLQHKQNLEAQRKQTVQYPVSVDEFQKSKKSKKQAQRPTQYFLMNADVFFEKDFKVINKHYFGKERNQQSVPELLYFFFYFYTYEFDPSQQEINIKEGGFSQKAEPSKLPFSIVDPFEKYRNPGTSVKFETQSYAKIQMQFRAALDHFK